MVMVLNEAKLDAIEQARLSLALEDRALWRRRAHEDGDSPDQTERRLLLL